MALGAFFPAFAYPLSYVVGILFGMLGFIYADITYAICLSEAFKHYKTGSLKVSQISSIVAVMGWFMIIIVSVTFTIPYLVSKVMALISVLLVFVCYSNISIEDEKIFTYGGYMK